MYPHQQQCLERLLWCAYRWKGELCLWRWLMYWHSKKALFLSRIKRARNINIKKAVDELVCPSQHYDLPIIYHVAHQGDKEQRTLQGICCTYWDKTGISQKPNLHLGRHCRTRIHPSWNFHSSHQCRLDDQRRRHCTEMMLKLEFLKQLMLFGRWCHWCIGTVPVWGARWLLYNTSQGLQLYTGQVPMSEIWSGPWHTAQVLGKTQLFPRKPWSALHWTGQNNLGHLHH